MRLGMTGRATAALAVTVLCAVGCSASSTPTTRAASQSPTPAAEKIHISFREKPERWRTVTTFSYGDRRDQFGPPGGSPGVTNPDGTVAGGILATTPSAIAVVGKTVWVLDRVKDRAAHFTLNGRYLGAAGGIPRSARELPRAISKAGDTGALDYSVNDATLHVSMKPAWDRSYELTSRHEVLFDVAEAQVFKGHTYLWLGVAESRRRGAGGAFLLELDEKGSVARLERVAITPDDATVYRPFDVASDGSVYQLYASNTRAELRVRP
jgi:hypothetical protein